VTPRSRGLPAEAPPAPLGTACRVERRERFVDQPQARLRDQRTRQPDALALAARQPVDALPELVAPGSSALERGGQHVGPHRRAPGGTAKRRLCASPHCGKARRQHGGDDALARRQRRGLRRDEELATQAPQCSGVEQRQASCPSSSRLPCVGGSTAAQHVEQAGLAGARGADQRPPPRPDSHVER
jgi:hypothetical protein